MNITIHNLCKSFGAKKVLSDFSCTLPDGKITAVMGSSGIGKTTLANILLGFEMQDSGVIEGLPEKKSAVFQENRLSENFSSLTNVTAVCKTKDAKAKAENMLCKLGLADDIKTKVSALSGGMKRRVALARALCADYEFLVMDEPFKGLDELTKAQTMQYVKKMTNGKTVLLITHNMDEASFLADQIIRFDNIQED